jgi:heptaprenyl diphosphate synthase
MGRLFQPVFFLSLTGGLTATLAMAVALHFEEKWLSLIGISIIGALFHNLAQLVIASLYIHHMISSSMISIFLMSSLITGGIIGYFTLLVYQALIPHAAASF